MEWLFGSAIAYLTTPLMLSILKTNPHPCFGKYYIDSSVLLGQSINYTVTNPTCKKACLELKEDTRNSTKARGYGNTFCLYDHVSVFPPLYSCTVIFMYRTNFLSFFRISCFVFRSLDYSECGVLLNKVVFFVCLILSFYDLLPAQSVAQPLDEEGITKELNNTK